AFPVTRIVATQFLDFSGEVLAAGAAAGEMRRGPAGMPHHQVEFLGARQQTARGVTSAGSVMTSELSPQGSLVVYWGIFLAYWLSMFSVAAFSLRMACGIGRVGMPSWPRAFVSVVLVSFLAYLVFDFTCYVVMRSLDGVLLQVPPGYSYGMWFREPFALKW